MREFLYLKPEDLTREYYNVLADLPFELDTPLDPQANQPIAPEKLLAILPEPLIEQEVSKDRFKLIPEPVLKEYAFYRHTHLYVQHFWMSIWEQKQRTKIYYKNERTSPTDRNRRRSVEKCIYLTLVENSD